MAPLPPDLGLCSCVGEYYIDFAAVVHLKLNGNFKRICHKHIDNVCHRDEHYLLQGPDQVGAEATRRMDRSTAAHVTEPGSIDCLTTTFITATLNVGCTSVRAQIWFDLRV